MERRGEISKINPKLSILRLFFLAQIASDSVSEPCHGNVSQNESSMPTLTTYIFINSSTSGI